MTPDGPGEGTERPRRGALRLVWFVLIYAGSLAAFAAAVYGFRALIPR